MNRTLATVIQVADEATEMRTLADVPEAYRIDVIAAASGDLTSLLDETQLHTIGADCVADYERDLTDRAEWEAVVRQAFAQAMQEKLEAKSWPWTGASNVNYPLLTTSALQFAARAYPAIVKSDEVVNVKVVGADQGRPVVGPDGQPLMQMGPAGPVPVFAVPPGAKAARATRVRDYLNATVFYRMDGWEADTDALLHQLPIAGCAFRKCYWREGVPQHSLVPALKLVAPMSAKDCKSAPRLTEVMEDQTLNDVIGQQRRGHYRAVDLVAGEDSDAPRKLLEQHCLIDLDGDGYAEPYIVTLDHQTAQVLRIEANFDANDVMVNQDRVVAGIERRSFYVKYDFFPNFEGGFYGIGLGHLLEQVTKVVNQSVNQIVDAGTAATAGGGFVGSGVDLQGAGRRSSSLYFAPGEYKTVNVSGSALREAFYERTFPGPSQITFSVLELMLGAAKDISSVKDVLTGEASNNGQVGTTLALIEQGLQVFTAIYKRLYRSLKDEFAMLFGNIGRYGGEAAARDYADTLDDPAADFATDFNGADLDIRPVSDPANVTRMQKLARANFLMQFIAAPGVNPQAIYKRVWEAADVEDPDELMAPPAPPPPPDPKDVASAQKDMARAGRDEAETAKTIAETARVQAETDHKKLETLATAFGAGFQVG